MQHRQTHPSRYTWRVEILLYGVAHVWRYRKDVCLRGAVHLLGNHLPNGLKPLVHGINELRVIGIDAVQTVVVTY